MTRPNEPGLRFTPGNTFSFSRLDIPHPLPLYLDFSRTSPSVFLTLSHQAATGDKPLHYLQRLRIETAKGMLSSTRKSIKTISYEVGYDDASFFARLFRQHTELSPHHYRRQFMQKES